MSTVTVKTAAAVQAILDGTIASAAINPTNGHLILTKHGGGTIDAGNARGGQGIKGDPGDVSTAEMNAAILVAIVNSGTGIIAHDEVGTEQTWGFDADGWNEITGLAATFVQTTDHHYILQWGIVFSSGADLVNFDVELRNGATPYGFASVFGPENGHYYGAPGQASYKATTTGSKTFKLFGRGNTPNDIHVQSDHIHTFLTVTDIGIL